MAVIPNNERLGSQRRAERLAALASANPKLPTKFEDYKPYAEALQKLASVQADLAEAEGQLATLPTGDALLHLKAAARLDGRDITDQETKIAGARSEVSVLQEAVKLQQQRCAAEKAAAEKHLCVAWSAEHRRRRNEIIAALEKLRDALGAERSIVELLQMAGVDRLAPIDPLAIPELGDPNYDGADIDRFIRDARGDVRLA